MRINAEKLKQMMLADGFYGYHPRPDSVISKSKLIDGAYYQGYCRNASVAKWNAAQNVFTYPRSSMVPGDIYNEDINHFEDDDGYDIFIPMNRLDVSEVEEHEMPICE